MATDLDIAGGGMILLLLPILEPTLALALRQPPVLPARTPIYCVDIGLYLLFIVLLNDALVALAGSPLLWTFAYCLLHYRHCP